MGPLGILLAFLGGLAGLRGSSSAGEATTGSAFRLAEVETKTVVSGPSYTEDDLPSEEDEDPVGDEPAPTPTPPTPPEQPGDGGSGGETDPTIIADGTTEVMAGRVATLDPAGDDITSVRIVSGVEHGTVTVNPDNTMALVMTLSDFIGAQSYTYEATHADGSVTTHEVGLDVIPGLQDSGWGTSAAHYMLETDENDKIVPETGEVHTKVYVSGSDSALSLADIATLEGLAIEDVTGKFLANNGYGQSEEVALTEEAATALWSHIAPEGTDASHWLLFESGYQYGDMGTLIIRDTGGEDPLHPMLIGAWGEGDRPEITELVKWVHETSSDIVIQDIHFSGGISILNAENLIFDNIKVTEDQMSIQISSGITIRNSEIYDAVNDAPSGDDGNWAAIEDREQGLYVAKTDGLLIEGSFFDHNGWEDGYAYDGDGASGQPPSQYSHNMYLAASNRDVTIQDTISMRSASFGLGVRSGAFIEDVVLIDNNAALSFDGGNYADAGFRANYTLVTDTVITSAGYREAEEKSGALSLGLQDLGQLTSLVDNIVTHLADPNSDELDYKYWTHGGLKTMNPYYDDTIVYNWIGGRAIENGAEPGDHIEGLGLDTDVLDQTTIQLFTAQLLGQETATIEDLANYLRAQADGAFDDIVDADLIIRFFQEGFGIAPDLRSEAETLRFVPNDLGDGVRWDNRLNWSTEDLPGTVDGDSVDLGGNHVIYGGTTEIDTLDFGPGGQLDFHHGKLTVTGGLHSDTEGRVEIAEAGQLWTEGSGGAGDIDIAVSGGRFANTGTMENADLTATGGQTILATGGAEYDVAASRTLAIFAEAAKVGFDGDDGGMAILDLHEGSTLAFAAGDGGLGSIAEFRSGALGDAPDVQSGIDLGGTTLEIDLTGLSATAGTEFTLMDADELVGVFNDPAVGGLGARDATIVVDYLNDSVTLKLSAGTGLVTVETLGEESDVTAGEEDLWAALTADQGLAEDQPLPEEDELLDAVA